MVPMTHPPPRRLHLATLSIGRFVVGSHLEGEWLVTVVLGRSAAGETGVVELHLQPAGSATKRGEARRLLQAYGHLTEAGPPKRFMTVSTLRALPVGSIVADHWQAVREAEGQTGTSPASFTIGSGKGSRGVRTPEDLALLMQAHTAAQYARHVRSGHPRPLQELSQSLGISVSGVRARLDKARDAGLLTRPRRGKAGGDLTPKGRRLMEDLEERSGANHG